MPKKMQVGIYLNDITNIQDALTQSRDAGFGYMCIGLVSPTYRQNELKGFGNNSEEPFSWFDMSLGASDWYGGVMGILSDVQEHLESPDPELRLRASKLLEREVGYMQHLGVHSMILNLHPSESINLARVLNSKISVEGGSHSNALLWVRMPMTYQSNGNGMSNDPDSDDNSDHSFSSWNTWNKFRSAGNTDRRTYPILDLPLDIPDDEEIDRWLGEPVKAILIGEGQFITNPKGYPVLPKRAQKILKAFFDIGSQVIIKCRPDREPTYYTPYKQYIDYLYRGLEQEWDEDPVRKYTKGYEDFLQSPLQPLMDNLEASTYEVFERDPIKYELYQEAVCKALLFKIPDEEKETKTLVVMVVGAGRGPIVKNCLCAADSVQRKIKVFALEKNVNAVCTLLHLKQQVWGDRVTIISSDMREWEPVEKADILVSELLGSFGDNELSPECLDGAQRILKADGIMIPQRYTSYIAPIMCPRLHGEVRPFFDVNKHALSHFETPYVVYLKNFYEIDRPKSLFKFDHPRPNPKSSNDRYATLEFKADLDTVLHGFAGYFDSILFDDVLMSIHPNTHSPGMFSWFPIFFPIREPIQVKKGDMISVHFWRCSNKHNVWYEWSVSSPSPIPIHNLNGRSYTIGL